MTVSEVCKALGGEVQCEGNGAREITGATAGDLLSFVMGTAPEGAAWVTVQAHLNVIAVAVLADMSCVIAAEGVKFPPDAVAKAQSEDLALLECDKSAYEICSIMARAGIQ